MDTIGRHNIKWILVAIYLFGGCTGPNETVLPRNIPTQQIKSYPLRSEDDLDILLNEMGSQKIVLLGEASHGTAEYYNWRAYISKRLIAEKGFTIVAVEGDHIDMHRLNQCIKTATNDSCITNVLSGFNRWPQWLWSNTEFAEFVQWVKHRNDSLPDTSKVNLSGLDVFNFTSALNELVTGLNDSTALHHARRAQDCLKQIGVDAMRYSTAVSKGSLTCREQVSGLWQSIQQVIGKKIDNEKELSTIQHAAVLLDGELYFRLRNSDAAGSWNTRVRHMQETIRRLLQFYDSHARIIVWAHNTHIGDARYTDMPTRRRTNIGELLRKEYGDRNVFSVGFGCYSGEIIAGSTWGAPFSKIKIQPARPGSWEQILHTDGPHNKIVLSKDLMTNEKLKSWLYQRAIGVVYSETYTPSIIPRRYDAFIYFDTTHSIHPLKK